MFRVGPLFALPLVMALKSSFMLAPLLFAVACSSNIGSDDPGTDPTDPNNPENVNKVAGTYEVTSAYDLRNSPDVSESIADALGPLTGLSDDPAGALMDALEGTEVGDLLDSLPSAIRSIVENQINDYIQEKLYEGVPVTGQIAEYVDMISTILTNFEVITTLKVGNADDAGNANAEHSLAAIAFPQDGMRHVVATPAIINALAIARDVSVGVDLSAGAINFGDHALELPLGDFAVTAFHQALSDKFGITDLGDALAGMVDCDGLAADIGDVSVAGFTVLSESQLVGFCTDGLDKVAQKVDDQIRNLEVAQLHFMGGDASVSMQSDSKIGSMDGTWQSEFGINSSGVAVPADFKAERQ